MDMQNFNFKDFFDNSDPDEFHDSDGYSGFNQDGSEESAGDDDYKIYTGNAQFQLVKPYFDRLVSYDPGCHGNFVDYSYYLIRAALAFRWEHELIPDYIRQVDSYIMGSEINIISTMFMLISDKIPEDYWKPKDMRLLYDKLVDTVVRERSWSEDMFQARIFTDLGFNVMGLSPEMLHGVRSGKDYN